jgi:Zn-dependent protease with chaperone function
MDMGKETGWQIIFEGHLFEGQKKSLVKKRIAALFNMDQPSLDNLFTGGPVILKSDLDYPRALKYQAAFQKTGAKCRILSLKKTLQTTSHSGQLTAPFTEKTKTEKEVSSPFSSQMAKAFQTEMNHFPIPWTFKIGLVFVDLGLAIMLLLYLLLIVAFGYGGYSLALANLKTMLNSWIGKILGVILFLITMLIVTTILFFIIKPLLPHRFKKTQTLELNPFKEQLLFSFIQQLCGIIRTPMPRRIEIDCNAGLSLRFNAGFASYLGGELVLILGMPLVAGLSLNQLAGLLGHELRRFAEGTNMRLTSIARRMNNLFAEGSASGDSIDAKFVVWNQADDLWLQTLAQVGLFLAMLSRKLMWLWLQGCLLISGYLLQQLEYDADRYEVQLTGSERFADTRLRVNTLDLVTRQTLQNLAQDWKERHLADDLINLVLTNVEKLPQAIGAQLKRNLSKKETPLFSTRPSDKDRIALATAHHQTSLMNLEMPAKELFTDFPDLARRITLDYYRSQMKLPVTDKNLLPVTAVVKHQDHLQTNQTRFKKYLADLFINLRPLPLQAHPEWHGQPLKERIGNLLKLAVYIKKLSIKDKQGLKDFQALDEKILTLVQANALLQADLIIEHATFNLADGTLDVAKRALKKALADKTNLESQISKLLVLVANRLELAFSLLDEPQIMKHMPNAEEAKKESSLLLKTYPEFIALFPLLDNLRSACAALSALTDNLKDNKGNEPFLSVFREKQAECKSHLTTLYGRLKGIDYPSESGEKNVSIAEFIMENDPEKIDEQALLASSQSMIDNMLNLHTQLVGRMAIQAEAVERMINLIIKNQPKKNP